MQDMTGIIRIVLIDDHPVVRAGIRQLLQRVPDIVIVRETGDYPDALHLIEELLPDVVLLSVMLPGLTGMEVVRKMQAAGLPVYILALSACNDEHYIFELLSNGATGYLLKEEELETSIDTMREVVHREWSWFSRRLTAKGFQHHYKNVSTQQEMPLCLMPLSVRQWQVLKLLAQGWDNRRIAEALAISERTVKNHITTIYMRINVRTRAEAVAWVWQHKLLEPEEQGYPDN